MSMDVIAVVAPDCNFDVSVLPGDVGWRGRGGSGGGGGVGVEVAGSGLSVAVTAAESALSGAWSS